MPHPYQDIPPHQLWRRSVGTISPADVDPVVRGKFRVETGDKVATAGSCFAQHIARHLKGAGFNYFVSEPPNPYFDPALTERFNYGVFSARYGNIYTARQLIQTLRRAYGLFSPVEDVWMRPDGRVVDPFRPQIQPDGFASLDEFHADRKAHLAAIRRLVEQLDVLVFTLGLTEGWISRLDGAAFPICPGVSGGIFDDTKHQFVNQTVSEVIADMDAAIEFIRDKNPAARFVLTVSPVPLVATAMDRSVLVSTTYSKAVLRAAVEEIANRDPRIAYFPSYEIITGNFNRGAYFASDLRSVTEDGVGHVMRLFMRHYAGGGTPAPENAPRANEVARQAEIERTVAVICEEEVLDTERPAQ